MILDAAETVLGIFGFDRRSVYGNSRKSKASNNRKWSWWEELGKKECSTYKLKYRKS
jgi:hypothetical protein